MLEVWLKGNISPSAELFNEDLDEADNIEVIRKLLDTPKSSLMEEIRWSWRYAPAKHYYNSTLKIPMKRDRGLIYAQLIGEHVALNDELFR